MIVYTGVYMCYWRIIEEEKQDTENIGWGD